jgi:hypothetical protein
MLVDFSHTTWRNNPEDKAVFLNWIEKVWKCACSTYCLALHRALELVSNLVPSVAGLREYLNENNLPSSDLFPISILLVSQCTHLVLQFSQTWRNCVLGVCWVFQTVSQDHCQPQNCVLTSGNRTSCEMCAYRNNSDVVTLLLSRRMLHKADEQGPPV